MKNEKTFNRTKNTSTILLGLLILIFSLASNNQFISYADGPINLALDTELSSYEYLPYYQEWYKSNYLNYKNQHPNTPWEQAIITVNLALEAPFYTNIQTVINPEDITCLVNKTHQLDPDFVPPDLQLISKTYSSGTLYLRKEAKVAFESMCREAKALGLSIKAVSAYRSYAYQDNLYKRKIRLYEPATIVTRDQSVARAGHSEHQLGLAVDVKGIDSWVENTKEYAWYSKNAHRFGYIIRYPKGQEAQTGYHFEPWHLRYVGVELAQKIYQSGMTYDAYHHMMTAQEPKAESVVTQVVISEIRANFQGYLHQNKTYIKLRDLEKRLSNTSLAFTLQWDEKTKRIRLDHTEASANEPYVQPPFLSGQNEQYAIQIKPIIIDHESKQKTVIALIKDNQIYLTQDDFMSLWD